MSCEVVITLSFGSRDGGDVLLIDNGRAAHAHPLQVMDRFLVGLKLMVVADVIAVDVKTDDREIHIANLPPGIHLTCASTKKTPVLSFGCPSPVAVIGVFTDTHTEHDELLHAWSAS